MHVQVIAEDCEGILEDADAILNNIDDKVFIKVATTTEGLKAMRALKARGVGVTATAIYSKIQGFMAIACGADFIAPYCNRMENLDIDSCEVIASLRQMIDENGSKTRIVAASFKNMAQVTGALLAGAHAATIPPALLLKAFDTAAIKEAVEDFNADWVAAQGQVSIADLAK